MSTKEQKLSDAADSFHAHRRQCKLCQLYDPEQSRTLNRLCLTGVKLLHAMRFADDEVDKVRA